MEFIPWLVFIKIVLQVVKKFKKIVIKKKRLEKIVTFFIAIKRIVIIEKDCDKKKTLQKKIYVSNRMNSLVM